MRRRKRGGGYVESLRFDDDKFDELMMMVDHPPSIKPKGSPASFPLPPPFPGASGFLSFPSFLFHRISYRRVTRWNVPLPSPAT